MLTLNQLTNRGGDGLKDDSAHTTVGGQYDRRGTVTLDGWLPPTRVSGNPSSCERYVPTRCQKHYSANRLGTQTSHDMARIYSSYEVV